MTTVDAASATQYFEPFKTHQGQKSPIPNA